VEAPEAGGGTGRTDLGLWLILALGEGVASAPDIPWGSPQGSVQGAGRGGAGSPAPGADQAGSTS
jgi:hypothetical protein